MRLSTRAWHAALVGALLAVSGCGATTATPPGAAPSQGSSDHVDGRVVVEPGEKLVAHGLLLQSAPDRPVEICVGGVAESLPPQCGGPVLEGDFSWDDVAPQRSGDVTWTDTAWWAVGTYDPGGGGDQGSFTLSRPVSADPPEGYAVPSPGDVSFEQLCEDPYIDGDRSASGDLGAQERLAVALDGLDGYVTSWVSDGSSLFNVVVTSDPEAAFAQLRTVWKGGLCVEQRDLPTQAAMRAAQEALSDRFAELRLLSAGAGGVSGRLEVEVVVTDRATVDAVLETVAPWLDPQDVTITGALRPLAGD